MSDPGSGSPPSGAGHRHSESETPLAVVRVLTARVDDLGEVVAEVRTAQAVQAGQIGGLVTGQTTMIELLTGQRDAAAAKVEAEGRAEVARLKSRSESLGKLTSRNALIMYVSTLVVLALFGGVLTASDLSELDLGGLNPFGGGDAIHVEPPVSDREVAP